MKTDVLGVKIDDVSMVEALLMVEKWVRNPDKHKHYIVTPNPEIIVAAQKDNRLKKILNDADLSIPDGVGLQLSGKVKNIVSGIDLMEKLVKLSAEKGLTAGFLGGRDRVAVKCAERLREKYPGLRVGFAENGGEVDKDGNVIAGYSPAKRESDNDEAIFRGRLPRPARGGARNDEEADILFVAFGQIKQEKWIANNLEKMPVKVMMAVGGSFDFLSGNIPRAPKWVRNLGCEWLFRLVGQPQRIKRQLALLEYVWLLFLSISRIHK